MANLCMLIVVALLAAFVNVEGARLKGGQLLADQDPVPWWDEAVNQWVLRLTCGYFTFQGIPPLNVTWTTPLGEAKFSSGYDAGRFYLNLDVPVQGGNYSCAIPSEHLPLVCEDEEQKPCSNVSGEVNVDELKARLALAEANQKTLEEMVEEFERRHARDVANVFQLCQDVKVTVDEHQDILEDIQELLEKENKKPDLSGPCSPDMYTELNDAWRSVDAVLDWDNHCDDELEHGWYRFLLNGSNAVVPTYCIDDHHCETHAPQWLDLQGQPLPAVGQETEGRACANWNDDCCYWDSPISVRNCGAYYVYKLQPRSTCYLAYCAKPQ